MLYTDVAEVSLQNFQTVLFLSVVINAKFCSIVIWFSQKIAKLKGVPELSTLEDLIISVGVQSDGSPLKCTSFLKSCPNLQKFVLQVGVFSL